MPDARCTRGLMRKVVEKARMSIQGSGEHPTFPAQWLYGLLRALPGEPCTVATADANFGASGPHVFAVRSTRLRQEASPGMAPIVKGTSASIAPRPAFVTIASAPLVGTGWRSYATFRTSDKANYFRFWVILCLTRFP